MARRPNAYSQLIQEGSTMSEAAVQSGNANTVKPQTGKAATRQRGNTPTTTGGKTVKITIYPNQEQLDKLYDFMEAYRKKTRMRINQQDMIRRIIDRRRDIDTVLP